MNASCGMKVERFNDTSRCEVSWTSTGQGKFLVFTMWQPLPPERLLAGLSIRSLGEGGRLRERVPL